MFRRVSLPNEIPGRLFLTAMPGRYEPMSDFSARITSLDITQVVCLTPLEEILEKSEEYYRLILSENHKWKLKHFPIPDFGVPDNTSGFLNLAQEMADALKSGENIIIHCAAGIGRTGTFAMILLMTLGMERTDAAAAVRMADAEPEGLSQRTLIDWCSRNIKRTSNIRSEETHNPVS